MTDLPIIKFDHFDFRKHLLVLGKEDDLFEVYLNCKSPHGQLFAVEILAEGLAAFRHLLNQRRLSLRGRLQ